MKAAKNRTAFTLIELLVVIAIIALLVSILLPALQGAKMMANQMVGLANHKNILTAFRSYVGEYQDITPPCLLPLGIPANFPLGQLGPPVPLTSTGQRMWYCEEFQDARTSLDFYQGRKMGIDPGPKWWSVGSLYQTGFLDNHKIVYPSTCCNPEDPQSFDVNFYTCSAKQAQDAKMPSKAGTWVWYMYPRLGAFENRGTTPYTYFRPSIPQVPLKGALARRMDKIASYPFFMDQISSWERCRYLNSKSDPRGLTTGYGDGHALFRTDKKLFDEDLWIAAIGFDPWNVKAVKNNNAGYAVPSDDEKRFLPIYLALCDLEPKGIIATEYMLNNELYLHCWK